MTPQIKMIVGNWYTDELGKSGTLYQGVRLNEERVAGSRPPFSIRPREVDRLAPQARHHVKCERGKTIGPETAGPPPRA
jgi:hypothetical protein